MQEQERFQEKERISRVAVVVVNYNCEDVIGDCLASISENGRVIKLSVYVVDNGSTDGSVELIKNNFPNTKVIKSDSNLGFAKANNKVLSNLSTEYALLINPDVILPPGALQGLIQFMDAHPEVAIIGPKQIDMDGNFNPASKMGRVTAINTLSRSLGLNNLFPEHPLFSGYYLGHVSEGQVAKVDAVSGACMLLRTRVIRDLGGFDERFPLGCEDLDLCYRVGEVADIYYYPSVIVTHLGKHARKRNWEESIKRFTEGAKLLYCKYEAGLHPEWYNYLVIKGLELSAVARICFTRLPFQLGKKE